MHHRLALATTSATFAVLLASPALAQGVEPAGEAPASPQATPANHQHPSPNTPPTTGSDPKDEAHQYAPELDGGTAPVALAFMLGVFVMVRRR